MRNGHRDITPLFAPEISSNQEVMNFNSNNGSTDDNLILIIGHKPNGNNYLQ